MGKVIIGKKHINTEIESSNLSFVLGPTNTGKTYYAINRMASHDTGIIGLPLRLLAREVYDKLVLKKNKLSVALITGEEQIIPPRAKYFVCTVEAMPSDRFVDFVAVDEIQLCNDYERGHIFTDRLFSFRGNLETLFLGSDAMENIIKKLFPKANIIKKKRRSELTYIGKKRLFSLPKRSAIIAFKTSDVYSIASKIKAAKGGAAVVLGALSPKTRNSQVSMFEEGSVDYIVATDAIGMGLNLNINNVSFSDFKKFDGKKLRFLKNTELAQIAGRAGRNEKEGYFSNTLNTPILQKNIINSIENNLFDSINFLYWRNKNLDFSNVKSLIISLEKKSNNSLLVKTLNNRDEIIFKHLVSLNEVRPYLNNFDNIKLLWEISTIPDYIKSLHYNYTDLLVKLFISLIKNQKIENNWAIKETLKLQNDEGPIDTLMFRLSKTRFWNFISNRSHWFSSNTEIKELAQRTENMLSLALHDRLTKEFVDHKLKTLVKEINFDKKIEIIISEDRDIILNNRKVGKIVGLEIIFFDKDLLKKNKNIYNQIIQETKKEIAIYITNLLNQKDFKININNKLEINYKNYKIGSIYKGENLYKPKILISNNNFIDDKLYFLLHNKISDALYSLINIAFWDKNIEIKTSNNNLKAILFSLVQSFGIVKTKDVYLFYSQLNENDLNLLKKLDIIFNKNHIYFKKVFNQYKDLRWILICIYFDIKAISSIPKSKYTIASIKNNTKIFHCIGFIKLKKFAVKISFLEKFFNNYLMQKKSVYLFNYTHLRNLGITVALLEEILIYFNLKKIAGTKNISYWIKINNFKTSTSEYNKDSPFYVLKKLQ